jgi:hypothetical protein
MSVKMVPGSNTMIAILALAGMFCCGDLFFGHQQIVCEFGTQSAQCYKRIKLNRNDVWSNDAFASILELISII